MEIYINLVRATDEKTVSAIKSDLKKNLQKYYGISAKTSITEFYENNANIEVFVMDQAKYADCDNDIINDIKKIVGYYITDIGISVKLNYRKFGILPYNINSKTAAPSPQIQNNNSKKEQKIEEFDYEKLSQNYQADAPHYTFEQVILPETVKNNILEAVGTIQVESKVFDEWGLRTIIPNASSALSFYGPPGTGKSMAAEAVASKLGKKILKATYADIESKFHGEGPKMVKAIFRAAERDQAVLFLDESDSLLSKRLTNVSDGSAQAINSMRSQLLICLEQFKGIVIFATNLVVNYDKAFLSRLINIEFVMPDVEARKEIWKQHLTGKGLHIPLASDIDISSLAEKYEFCGREIKNSVKDACVSAAIKGKNIVSQSDLIKASEKTKIESEKVLKAEDHTKSAVLTPNQSEALKNAVQKKLDTSSETNEKTINNN